MGNFRSLALARSIRFRTDSGVGAAMAEIGAKSKAYCAAIVLYANALATGIVKWPQAKRI